jgi:hypothetical protein
MDFGTVTTGPLERWNCRVHLRGRCRDLLTDAFFNAGWQMHPVEEDSRFVIQPVYPDRQSFVQGRGARKKKPSLFRPGKKVPCCFRPASTIFRKLDQTWQKNERGWFWDHPKGPRVTVHKVL